MWTLIITLVLNFNGRVVTSVPGYKTEASCIAGANKWLNSMKSLTNEYSSQRAFALCTKME